MLAAKNLFPVLSTFVAPIFPEPIFRTSIFPKIFVTKKPNDIEPLKYENKATRIMPPIRLKNTAIEPSTSAIPRYIGLREYLKIPSQLLSMGVL